jgi:hypothetical protein
MPLGLWLAAHAAPAASRDGPPLPFAPQQPLGGSLGGAGPAPACADGLGSPMGRAHSGSWQALAGPGGSPAFAQQALHGGAGGLQRTGSALGSGSSAALAQLQLLQLQRQGSLPHAPQPPSPQAALLSRQASLLQQQAAAGGGGGAPAGAPEGLLGAAASPAGRKRPPGYPTSPSFDGADGDAQRYGPQPVQPWLAAAQAAAAQRAQLQAQLQQQQAQLQQQQALVAHQRRQQAAAQAQAAAPGPQRWGEGAQLQQQRLVVQQEGYQARGGGCVVLMWLVSMRIMGVHVCWVGEWLYRLCAWECAGNPHHARA